LADQITGVLQHPQTSQRRWMALSASALLAAKDAVRLKPLLPAWLRSLASAAAGQPLQAVLVGRDATLTLAPPSADEARACLQALLALWWTGQHDPIALPWTTAALFAREAPEDKLVAAYEGAPGSVAEVSDPSLARLWPDTQTLLADPLFAHAVQEAVLPLMQFAEQAQIEQHPDGAPE
jgi:exodeoxyribonuclease V gamma subunit